MYMQKKNSSFSSLFSTSPHRLYGSRHRLLRYIRPDENIQFLYIQYARLELGDYKNFVYKFIEFRILDPRILLLGFVEDDDGLDSFSSVPVSHTTDSVTELRKKKSKKN